MNNEEKYKNELEVLKKEYNDFAYIVSHDLKADLRAVEYISSWIIEDHSDEISEDVKEKLGLIRGRIEHLNGMMAALVQYSRINRKELDIEAVDVLLMLNELKSEMLGLYENVQIDISGICEVFYTFRKKFHFVLKELMVNAIEHNLEKGDLKIRLNLRSENGFCFIDIIDNGKGVPESLEQDILKLFYTVSSKKNTKRIGSGLAIVKRILMFAGGNLELLVNKPNEFGFLVKWPIKNR